MPLLLRRARLLPLTTPAPDAPVDVRVQDGVVTEVGALTPARDERVLDAEGRWLGPGLWDGHVHLQQWARRVDQLDLSATRGPEEAVAVVAEGLRDRPVVGGHLVVGSGHRAGAWSRLPTVAELDAVAGPHAVALVSGDAHSGWLSTRALALLGEPPRDGPLQEAEWFALLPRLSALPTGRDPLAGLATAVHRAAALGVVGVRDMEWEQGWRRWPERVAGGVDRLRVRTATYPVDLDELLAEGRRTGDPLDPAGLVTVGPLKVITDGSVGTRTAWCCAPYPGPGRTAAWTGVVNVGPDELVALCARATAGGLEVALHAIGDAAVGAALDAVAATGAHGSVEHVQVLALRDVARFAALGVAASVQPAHLLDDRDLSAALWPDAQDRCFALGSLRDAGAVLRLGSDAPVAPLDPWLAMSAAVHRSADDRAPWTPTEALTPRQALAASTDGHGTVRAGSPADLVLLDDDPLAPAASTQEAAQRLRAVRVAATLVGGRPTWGPDALVG